MSSYLDSRNQNVKLRYDKLIIDSPTEFNQVSNYNAAIVSPLSTINFGSTNTEDVYFGALDTPLANGALNYNINVINLNGIINTSYMIETRLNGFCYAGSRLGQSFQSVTIDRASVDFQGTVQLTIAWFNNFTNNVNAGHNLIVIAGNSIRNVIVGSAVDSWRWSWKINIIKSAR